jgi:menaquinone-dependent protoporphyrinogen oxidase
MRSRRGRDVALRRGVDPFRMTRILIVYTSRHGHTAVIARRMAEVARSTGAEVVMRDADRAGEVDLHDFDVVIAGGSVHMERHDDALATWAEHHATTLNRMRTGFFSVSLTAAGDPQAARAYADRFEEDTGWIPTRVVSLAGALQYREYSLLTRQMLRQIARAKGLPTDTSRDHEFTDWAAVERFVTDVAAPALHYSG